MVRTTKHLPALPDEFRVQVSERYINLYEKVTGESFIPEQHPEPAKRIQEILKS